MAMAPPMMPAKKPEREEAMTRPILNMVGLCSSDIKSLNIIKMLADKIITKL